MADPASEKGHHRGSGSHSSASPSGSDDGHPERREVYARPTGFKGFWYNPVTQVVMLGFVCFMCPGLFNSLQGLGGGGQLKESTSANANSALYSTFAFFAFFAGCANTPLHMLARPLTRFLGPSTTPWGRS